MQGRNARVFVNRIDAKLTVKHRSCETDSELRTQFAVLHAEIRSSVEHLASAQLPLHRLRWSSVAFAVACQRQVF